MLNLKFVKESYEVAPEECVRQAINFLELMDELDLEYKHTLNSICKLEEKLSSLNGFLFFFKRRRLEKLISQRNQTLRNIGELYEVYNYNSKMAWSRRSFIAFDEANRMFLK